MAEQTLRSSRFTLGVKLSLFVVILVLAVSGTLAYFLVIRSASYREEAAKTRFASLARIVASMRGQGYGGRQYDPMLVKMLVNLGDQLGTQLSFVIFSDDQGKLEGGHLNLELLAESAPELARSLANYNEEEKLTRIRDWHFKQESVSTYKVQLKGTGGGALGTAFLGFSTVQLEREQKRSGLANLIVAAAAFVLGLIGALWLARHFTRPIREVAEAMHMVSEGDMEKTLTVRSRDEIGILAQSFNFMTQGLRERERIRSTFARYVSDQVAERILREEDELDLAGELRQVTVLFLDVRGFTTLAEYLDPRETVALLNDYFEIIIEVIFRYEGTINKFIGDSIMAIYGAPHGIDYPEFRGVLTAVDIQKAVGEFNWRRMQDGKPVVNFGIGVHSGEAIAGNVGSALRMEYTVIGRNVNLAQRIEATTAEGQILISEPTYKKISDLVQVQPKEAVFMKGIIEPIPLYEVTGMSVGSIEELRATVDKDQL